MRVSTRSILAVAGLVSAALIALPGCGGGDDTPAPAGHALVPGPGALPDTAAVDTTALDDALPAAETSAAAEPVLAPAGEQPRRTEPPRSADVARKPAPGGAFSLQLGSFRSLDNARRLVGRVENLGYAPVLESVVIGGETHHRVVLRGLPDRAEAASVGERLRSELGITYLIRQSD
jgi:cell division septation protein DedD